MYSREFQQSNTDMYGFKYRPIPLTVELKPLSENIGINGFLVSPEQVHTIQLLLLILLYGLTYQ